MGAWQPIETAPRNHLTVLVWSEDTGTLVAFLDVTWAWWPVPAVEPLARAPSFWMPLPEAPWDLVLKLADATSKSPIPGASHEE